MGHSSDHEIHVQLSEEKGLHVYIVSEHQVNKVEMRTFVTMNLSNIVIFCVLLTWNIFTLVAARVRCVVCSIITQQWM